MKNMVAVMVMRNGEQTSENFSIAQSDYKKNDIIDFYGHNFKVIEVGFGVIFAEEIE